MHVTYTDHCVERVADDPFRLILAVSLLNKTRWQQATPIFWRILEQWPTADDLAKVPLEVLTEVLQPLGLQNVRATRLILFSQQYVANPPCETRLHPLRVDRTYPVTAVAHLAGVGRYAADSWRIYSPTLLGGGGPKGAREILEGLREPNDEPEEWKEVLPLDKELRWYLIWRWAVEGYKWTPEHGRGDPVDAAYMEKILPDYSTR
ncbi:DNA glycosylase [Calocera viscosa TUFC12733]|uniref:DNA glycosylase n=1 Tax=Calocera viscosa (strain TUFC12733) TaxID=1330018 RepID=A0A167QJG4_CALVF|nr:DNA glycosylase [Calocera viscosa TUFC12733]